VSNPRIHAQIAAVGAYLPERVLTNADLERMVDTSDEWILTRTGIRERHIAAPGEATSDLSAAAARVALQRAGIEATELDLIIVATSTPDHVMPSAACLTAAKLGVECAAFDLNAACSGFVYALHTAAGLIEAGRARTALVVGADTLSSIVDFTDRGTCVLFGDGAGAVVLRAADQPGVMSTVLGSDGTGAEQLIVPAGGSKYPYDETRAAAREQFLRMNGPEVFKFAVRVIPRATEQALKASGHDVADLDWLVPHQANQRILNTVEERLGIDHAKVFSNLDRTGNTSAASIPLALDDLYTSGRLSPGDLLALVGFGAGLTWGAAVVTWTADRPHEEA